MTLTDFRFETDADGIAVATWDMPGRSMNVITEGVMDQLEQIIEQVASDAAIKGCVIATGKDNFSGGADLTMLQGLGRAYEQLKAEQGEEVAMRHFFEASRRSRCCSAGSRPAASRSPRRSRACAWAAPSSWPCPATTGSPPMMRRRGSGCRRSRSACSRAAAAPSGSPG